MHDKIKNIGLKTVRKLKKKKRKNKSKKRQNQLKTNLKKSQRKPPKKPSEKQPKCKRIGRFLISSLLIIQFSLPLFFSVFCL